MERLRYYNVWAGNPNGTKEDPKRCIAQVRGTGRWPMPSQCSRKRAYGPGAAWCSQHAGMIAAGIRVHAPDPVPVKPEPKREPVRQPRLEVGGLDLDTHSNFVPYTVPDGLGGLIVRVYHPVKDSNGSLGWACEEYNVRAQNRMLVLMSRGMDGVAVRPLGSNSVGIQYAERD